MSLAGFRLMTMGKWLLLGALLLFAESCLAPSPRPGFYQETALPAARIAKHTLALVAADLAAHPQSREALLLHKFYGASGGRTAWIDRRGIALAAWQLLEKLETADLEGLPPQRYDPELLRQLLQPAADESEDFLGWPPQQVAQFDIALSRAFFRYAGDNLWGQERSWRSRSDWHRAPQEVDPALLLELALELDAMPAALQEIVPHARDYRQLRQFLKRYREIAALGGWPEIAAGSVLRQGDSDPRVDQLRGRLLYEGDLHAGSQAKELFDAELYHALQRFQMRHGLTADGALGAVTLEALNVPAEVRLEQILRNMERWRWEPAWRNGPEIRINLADYRLAVSDAEQSSLQMPVIIGRQRRPTPIFASQLEALVISPYWYVPPTLLHETLPRIAADSEYLVRNHYEVLDPEGGVLQVDGGFGAMWQRGEVEASLRQLPGPWNPMGSMKFLLPNPWAIYLHDTPLKQLFSRTRRAFSSGCIRLSEPRKLARWLLQHDGWDQTQIDELLDSGASRMVSLKQPVTLSIDYWTAWVDPAGQINFRDDIYGHDLRLAKELRQTPPPLASAGP